MSTTENLDNGGETTSESEFCHGPYIVYRLFKITD